MWERFRQGLIAAFLAFVLVGLLCPATSPPHHPKWVYRIMPARVVVLPLVAGVAVFVLGTRADRNARAGDRRRRGLCVACGYDLTGNVSGVCPECGTPAGGVG